MNKPFRWNLSGLILLMHLIPLRALGQVIQEQSLLTPKDLQYLKELTHSVMESSRIYPGEQAVDHFGPNNTGGTLIRPGGREAYPSFWIRDYAMSLESGMVTPEEQRHMLLLTAAAQCDQTWITKGGSMIPLGAIPDHIRIDDGLPIFFPGTYSYEDQGIPRFGKTPPYGDQFFFIQMACHYVTQTGDTHLLELPVEGYTLLDRLKLAFHMLPEGKHGLVYTTDDFRGVDFGFRDVQVFTGYLCYPSLLKYRAALQLAKLMAWQGKKQEAVAYQQLADTISSAIPMVFMQENGLLRASTGSSSQGDVWATALAVYLNALSEEDANKASKALQRAYKDGTLAFKGNIRHILTSEDFDENTAWEISYAKRTPTRTVRIGVPRPAGFVMLLPV